VWKAKEISTKTKMKIFSSNVKSVLLYGCETWKVKVKFSPLQALEALRVVRG
jgi:hypothetical protein